MGTTPTVYVICDQNCKFEGMTKEQILTAIMQAVEGGEIKDVDTGFITTIKTINGTPLKFFVGEKSVYDALSKEEKKNVFAIITNDTTKADLLNAIKTLNEALKGITSGDVEVAKAQKAKTAEKLSGNISLHEVLGLEYIGKNASSPTTPIESRKIITDGIPNGVYLVKIATKSGGWYSLGMCYASWTEDKDGELIMTSSDGENQIRMSLHYGEISTTGIFVLTFSYDFNLLYDSLIYLTPITDLPN